MHNNFDIQATFEVNGACQENTLDYIDLIMRRICILGYWRSCWKVKFYRGTLCETLLPAAAGPFTSIHELSL